MKNLLDNSASRHRHLCPRQVLGVRMGLAGAAALEMEVPRSDKRLLVILETDGCFVDGVGVATGCSVGHRTLRVEDYGKVAATFVRVKTGQAIRLAPRIGIREKARQYAPDQKQQYFAQLQAYQVMPVDELFSIQEVALTTPIRGIVSHPGVRTNCISCGEEIINEREIIHNGLVYCQGCRGTTYYQVVGNPTRASFCEEPESQEIPAISK